MSTKLVRDVSTEDLIEEIFDRIANNKINTITALHLVTAIISSSENQLKEYMELNSDLEIALVAGLGKKSAMYGSQTKDEFITSKLSKWSNKLRFLHNYSKESKDV